MPNVSEFRSQCNALGLQYIEVKEQNDDSDIHSIDDIINVDGTAKVETISINTYELYENELKKTNIVFFCEDNDLGMVSFLANAVFYTEKGGAEESWTYKTKKISIPVNGGIRTFNESIKDELIASGIMGIMADSLDEEEGEGENKHFKANSLYGKIEDKCAALMAKKGKNTMAGVEVPWLYNFMLLNDRSILRQNSLLSDGNQLTGLTTRSILSESIPVWCYPLKISSNYYEYCFQQCRNVCRISTYDVKYTTWEKLVQTFLTNCLNHIPSWLQTSPYPADYYLVNSSTFTPCGVLQSIPEIHPAKAPFYQSSDPASYSSYGDIGSGGNPLNTVTTNDGQGSRTANTASAVFSTQPFIYGIVFYITKIAASEQNPYLAGYLTIVGIDKYGKVIKPMKWYKVTAEITYNNKTYAVGWYTEYELKDVISSGIYSAYIYSLTSIYPLTGRTNLIVDRGVIVDCSIALSPEEVNYANNLNYIISPNEFIPEGYFDDE